MGKHTQGTWVADHPDVRGLDPDVIEVRMNGVRIARMVRESTMSDDEAYANAALIARAPTLLRERDELREALRDLEQAMRDLSEQSDEGALDYIRLLRRGHGMFGRMEAARAVLSKVTP